MKSLFLFLAFFSLSSVASMPSEEIYTCKEDGKVTTRVFYDPSVYCEDDRPHEAVLLRESPYGATLFKGIMKQLESEKGEIFFYSSQIDGLTFRIGLTLPYEMGKGRYQSTYDEDVQTQNTLDCLMKQVHVECEN